MTKFPVQLSKDETSALTYKDVEQVKRLDCSFYNDCLDVAVKGNWAGFGCSNCSAYQAMDIEQRVQDVLALRVAQTAAEHVGTSGKANRRRGVKPGADAKVRKRLRVVQDAA